MKTLKPNDSMTLQDAKQVALHLEMILSEFDRFEEYFQDHQHIINCVRMVRGEWRVE